jgi:hypothetical protein
MLTTRRARRGSSRLRSLRWLEALHRQAITHGQASPLRSATEKLASASWASRTRSVWPEGKERFWPCASHNTAHVTPPLPTKQVPYRPSHSDAASLCARNTGVRAYAPGAICSRSGIGWHHAPCTAPCTALCQDGGDSKRGDTCLFSMSGGLSVGLRHLGRDAAAALFFRQVLPAGQRVERQGLRRRVLQGMEVLPAVTGVLLRAVEPDLISAWRLTLVSGWIHYVDARRSPH